MRLLLVLNNLVI